MRRTTRSLLAFAFALPLIAATLADVNLENSVSVNNQTLVLNGLGLRKKFFIKVYVGGLYLPAKNKDAAAILATDASRRMVMHFLYSVSKDQMCDAWSEGLEDNTPNASAEVKGSFKTLCTMMEAIPKGNRLVLTYVPGTGTTVEVNGKNKGTLPGKASADAMLATWLGPKPGPGEDFRNAVLGK
ncbi:MAG TPA: chalcone isomerase family protein [Thermoanaerobaculia bacterium]|nr:chalcone isomerase family protein [Thermoanaerobaculia bacterium]